MVVRFFKRFLAEVREVTTPEIFVTLLVAIAAMAFQHLFRGGISWNDALSILVPGIWVACIIGGFYIIKAAMSLRREDVKKWESWSPAIAEADFLRPPKPPMAFIYIVS